MLRVYSYKGCDSCRKALKWLMEREIEFENIPIRERPPSEKELKRMLECYEGDIRRLFNVSGGDYRALKLKDRIADMTREEAFRLLRGNGNLVKRPFAISPQGGRVGFKEPEWADWLGAR